MAHRSHPLMQSSLPNKGLFQTDTRLQLPPAKTTKLEDVITDMVQLQAEFSRQTLESTLQKSHPIYPKSLPNRHPSSASTSEDYKVGRCDIITDMSELQAEFSRQSLESTLQPDVNRSLGKTHEDNITLSPLATSWFPQEHPLMWTIQERHFLKEEPISEYEFRSYIRVFYMMHKYL